MQSHFVRRRTKTAIVPRGRVLGLAIVLIAAAAGLQPAHATYNLNLRCPGPGQTLESLAQPAQGDAPGSAKPQPSGSADHASPSGLTFAAGNLSAPAAASDLSASGVYQLEHAIDFNVLDQVTFDPRTSEVTLVGHRDGRFAGAPIPYLQHLAELLERPGPEFTLDWTPDSERKVDAFLARIDDPGELKRLTGELGTIWTPDGKGVTKSGAWLLRYLGVQPAANGGFPGLDRVDLNAAMLVKAGDRRAACVLLAMHTTAQSVNADQETKNRNLRALIAALGIEKEGLALGQQVHDGTISDPEFYFRVYTLLCNQLDRVFHLEGGPLSRAFAAGGQRRYSKLGFGLCVDEFDRQRRGITERAMDAALGRTREITVPVDGIASMLGTRPEVVPSFKTIDARSQLARVMLEADYLGKRLINLPDYEHADIPGYRTEFGFNRDNPSKRVDRDATQHLWFSIDSVDRAESPDGRTLLVRGAKMRINIRQYDRNGHDRPRIVGGYGDLLTSLYPKFEKKFPVLHELGEAAKVAATASWIRQKRPDFRLPKEGRQAWTPPSRLPGVIYMTVALVESKTSANTVLSAVGGVSLVVPYDAGGGVKQIGPDVGASVVDLRRLAPTQAQSDALTQIFDGTGKQRLPLPKAEGWSRKADAGVGAVSVRADGGSAAATKLVQDPNGASLVRANDIDAAIASARTSIAAASDPADKADRMVWLAYRLHEKGDDDAAVKTLNEARALDPVVSSIIIARNEAERGDLRAAVQNLDTYLALDPANAAAQELDRKLKVQLAAPASPPRGGGVGPTTRFEYPSRVTLWDDAAGPMCKKREAFCLNMPLINFRKSHPYQEVEVPQALLQNQAAMGELQPLLESQLATIEELQRLGGAATPDADAVAAAEQKLKDTQKTIEKKVGELKTKYELDPSPPQAGGASGSQDGGAPSAEPESKKD